MSNQRVYNPTPTMARFHADRSFFRGLMGPLGSGKSVACTIEVVIRAGEQQPGPDGVRRSRWAIIRNTFPELRSTTIKTWEDWVGPACPITYGSPITGRLRMPLGDGTSIDAEVFFFAMDLEKDVKKMLGIEITGAWLNEARELQKSVIDAVTSRVGRYPAKRDGGPTWSGIIADTNPPGTDHWWYRLSEVERPEGWNFFRQPGALRLVDGVYEANPEAENVDNQPLGYNYWLRQVGGKDPEWVNVHVLGNYGNVFSGKPVYEGLYNDALHASTTPLGIYRGLPLRLAWDFGLTPACVAGQLSAKGQLRVLREWVCENGALREFARDVVKPALANEFHGMTIISTADPAGNQRSQVDEVTCIDELARLGIPTTAAPTNDFIPRRQAVATFLTKTIDGGPGFILDPSCEMLRKGFLGGYKFDRVQVSGDERFKDVPTKNKFSHPADCCQYLALGVDESFSVAARGGKPRYERPRGWAGAV
jgi:hypothetical protein